MRRDRTAGLGRTQKLVLQLLADTAKSVRHLSYDWPGLTEGSARSAVHSLARRGLVDMAGWDEGNHRTYCLTERGVATERRISGLESLDEDDA